MWTELFESTEVLTRIFIDPCLLTVSQRDRASFLHVLDIGSSTWSQKMWVQPSQLPERSCVTPGKSCNISGLWLLYYTFRKVFPPQVME